MVIIKALAWALSLAAVVTWLVALVRWDGSILCDRSQCESCPFPRCHENGQADNSLFHFYLSFLPGAVLAIGLVLLVAVNVVLGSLNALFDGTFDRIKCRNGVIKGIIIAACFVAFYVAGRLNPDIVAIDIDGETVNVATAANLAMVTAYVLYAKDVFSKLSKLVLSKTSGTPEQTGGTTPPALEEPADAAEATAAE